MLARYTQHDCTWIDLTRPTPEEVRDVMEEFSLPPHLVADFGSPIRRNEAILAEGALRITLDFPPAKLTTRGESQEMKFIVTKRALITARYADDEAVHRFAKGFEVITLLERAKKELHGGHLFVALVDALYESIDRQLDYTGTLIANIEDELLNEREREMVFEISRLSQRLLAFRQILIAHEDILAHAKHHLRELFPRGFIDVVEDLEMTFDIIARHLASLTAAVSELRETNNSLLSTKQNEVMKTLTIMAFVTFPLSLFAALFGMNTEALPIVGMPGDFWIIIGIMATATLAFFAYFKYKRWM